MTNFIALWIVYGDVNCLQSNNNSNSGISLNTKCSNLIFIQPNALTSSGGLSSQIASSTPSTTTLIPQPITTNVLYSIQTNNASSYESYDHLNTNDLNASFQIDVESFVANLANLEVDPNDCFQRSSADTNQHLDPNQHQLSNDIYKLPSAGLDNELANVYNQTQSMSNSSLSHLPQQTLVANQQHTSGCLLPNYESNMEITKVDILNQVIQSSNNTSITDELEFEHFAQEDNSTATFRNKLKIRVKGKSNSAISYNFIE